MPENLANAVLILAPIGADAANSAEVLGRSSILAEICRDIGDLCRHIEAGGGAVLISEEALSDDAIHLLLASLGSQPKWSDIPLILVLKAGSKGDEQARLMRRFTTPSNITILERPLRSLVFLTTIQAALRSRARQYELRDLLAEQERAEQALAYQHRLIATIVEHASSCLVLADPEGRPNYVNPAFEKTTGFSLEDVRGKPMDDSFFPRQPESHTSGASFIRIGRVREQEPMLRRKDGTLFPARSFIIPVEQNGKAVGAIVEFRDITQERSDQDDLKAAQERLARHAEELEKRVADRTASLKQSVDSLEGVCYTIAHDLRAPLRAVQGFTQLLFESDRVTLTEEERDYARRVMAAATSMDALINDLLDYAKLSNQELPCEGVDLDKKIHDILHELTPEIQAANAEIQVGHLGVAWANETLVGQVLTNLLTNAMKFVQPGARPFIKITGERQKGVSICVEDNGIGIAPEHQERVFGVFQRLHKASLYPGTGIGLAIVKKGVERMGGKVWLTSTPGKGSCFWVELPHAPAKPR